MPPENSNQIQPKSHNAPSKWTIVSGVAILVILLIVFGYISLNRRVASIPTPAPTSVRAVNQHCSTYFDVCIDDSLNAWKVTTDSAHDFDLTNEVGGVSLAIAQSEVLKFNGAGPSLATVSLLGQNVRAYKDEVNGLTRVITGINNTNSSLIVLLSSRKDISADTTKNIVGSITTRKK